MRTKWLYGLLVLLLISAKCKKDPVPPVTEAKQWQKFIGHYKVYDTLGVYLFNADIQHFSGINFAGAEVDSIKIINFADTMNLNFKYSYKNGNFVNCFDIGFHNLVLDYNDKSWHVTEIFDDPLTSELENEMRGDSMVLYFKMTNLPYYINESVPYYYCECKHVYVKQ